MKRDVKSILLLQAFIPIAATKTLIWIISISISQRNYI